MATRHRNIASQPDTYIGTQPHKHRFSWQACLPNNYVGHHVKQLTIHSNQGCCHGNTFVKSGSLVKNDQSQQTC